MTIFLGEFIGTLLLILLGNGSVANVLLKESKGESSGWIVITTAWGFAVAMSVYTVGWATGGHLNPAVTFGLAIAQKTPWNILPLYILAQLLGAMAGSLLVYWTYYPHFLKSQNKTNQLLIFCTKPAIRCIPWNFATEVIATAVLLIGVLGISNYHNGLACGIGPIAVGFLVFSIGLSLGGPTGFAINPARDLGPRMMHGLLPLPEKGSSDWSYAWVPILGPFLGSAIGSLIYIYIVASLIPMDF